MLFFFFFFLQQSSWLGINPSFLHFFVLFFHVFIIVDDSECNPFTRVTNSTIYLVNHFNHLLPPLVLGNKLTLYSLTVRGNSPDCQLEMFAWVLGPKGAASPQANISSSLDSLLMCLVVDCRFSLLHEISHWYSLAGSPPSF